MTILDKLMEKKDLLIYIRARQAHLLGSMEKSVLSEPEARREMIRQRFIGRINELDILRELISNGQLKKNSCKMWDEEARNGNPIITKHKKVH